MNHTASFLLVILLFSVSEYKADGMQDGLLSFADVLFKKPSRRSWKYWRGTVASWRVQRRALLAPTRGTGKPGNDRREKKILSQTSYHVLSAWVEYHLPGMPLQESRRPCLTFLSKAIRNLNGITSNAILFTVRLHHFCYAFVAVV